MDKTLYLIFVSISNIFFIVPKLSGKKLQMQIDLACGQEEFNSPDFLDI